MNWKFLEGSVCGIIVVICRYLTGDTEKNHERPDVYRTVDVLAEIRR
jgi:hypothetical protein